MLSKVADLIEANADALANEWLKALEGRGNRLASEENRRQLLNDAVKWITALLRSLRAQDLGPMFRTSPLIAQRLALSGFPASDVVETLVVFKYLLWRLLRRASRRGQLNLARSVEPLEIFFDRIINSIVEEYEGSWRSEAPDTTGAWRAKRLGMRAEEEAILSRLAREIASERQVDRLLELILTSAANVVGARKAFAALTDNGRGLRHSAGCRLSLPRFEQWARDHAEVLAELAPAEGLPYAVSDLRTADSQGLRALGETLRVRSALWEPLRSRRGVIGYLALFDKVGGENWNERDAALVAQVAAQGAESLEEAAARREIEQRAEQLALLNEIGRAFSWQLSPRNLADLAAAKAAELLRARSSIVWLEEDDHDFRPRAVHNLTLVETPSFKGGAGVLGRGLTQAEPIIVSSQEAGAEVLAALGVRTALLVPMHRGKRHIGLLTLHDKEDGAFTETDIQLAAALEHQLSAALENAELYQESRRLSDKLQSSIASLGNALSAALDLDDLLQLIADHGLELSNARACTVLFSEDNRLERRGAAFAKSEGAFEIESEMERGVAAQAMEAAESQPLSVASSALFEAEKEALEAREVRACLALPLLIRGEPLGAILVWDRRARGVSADERDLLEAFSRQAAVGIENVLLFETSQKRVVELMDLSWVGEQLISTLDEPTVIETAVRGIARALDREIVGVAFLEDGRSLHIPERGYIGPCELPQGRLAFDAEASVCHRVITEGRIATVDDVEALRPRTDPLMAAVGARSFACAPLTGREGTFGLVFVGDTAVRPVTPHEEALLVAYAGQAALALENAKHHRDVVRRAADLETLLDVTRSLSSTLELEQTLNNVLRAAVGLLQLEDPVCSILLLDEQSGDLVLSAYHGTEHEYPLSHRIGAGEGIAGTVARTGMAVASRDLPRDGRFADRDGARREGLVSLLCVPLVGKGRSMGVLNIYTRQPHDFTPDEQALVFTLASEACMAIENARLYREARQQAQSMRIVMEEVNHRIKNNLQTIVGLMHLYMAECGDPATCEALRGIVGRIQAIAVVHELLLDTDITAVDAKEASQRILDNARLTMAAPGLKVSGQVSGAHVRLPSRKATALASAINELVTNAVKHGFAGRTEGNILVSLQEGAGKVLVQVRDNGIGLPEGFDARRDGKLGLRIVQGIVEQDLDGEFTLSSNGGTTARITFAK